VRVVGICGGVGYGKRRVEGCGLRGGDMGYWGVGSGEWGVGGGGYA